MFYGFLACTFLVILLFFFSIVESSIGRLSHLALRVLAEKEKGRPGMLRAIASDRSQFLLPLQFGNQILLVVIALLTGFGFVGSDVRYAPLWAIVVMVGMIGIFRQLLPVLIAQSNPEKVLLWLLPSFRYFYISLRWISTPLFIVLRAVSKASEEKGQVLLENEEEATDEEIQAYLGVGEEEGIIEENESKLIQSALEFGDTSVRAIMTPRTEIIAIEESATLAELKGLIVSSKFSRIPVYRETVDQVVGVVYVRNLLSYLDEGRGEESITPLTNKAWFIPETKKVSQLLREMQSSAEHLAIVINEYAAVTGLVTIEDVIEEIVGEIRDEDEAEKLDLVDKGEQGYIVSGGAEIEELEEALEMDLGELYVTTVSGLVVEHLGKVPPAGEKVVLNGLLVEILSSDQKKIQRMRIRKLEENSPREE